MSDEVELVKKFVDRFGIDEVRKKLSELEETSEKGRDNVLTILCNSGVHRAPPHILNGYVYEASRGNLDFSNLASIEAVYSEILVSVTQVLKRERWDKIYLVPFGHPTLSMQIKVLVYRVTGMDTTDWFYLGELGYLPLSLPIRSLIVAAGPG
jgi:hypothetical protein